MYVLSIKSPPAPYNSVPLRKHPYNKASPQACALQLPSASRLSPPKNKQNQLKKLALVVYTC